jgi:hypothetical protein
VSFFTDKFLENDISISPVKKMINIMVINQTKKEINNDIFQNVILVTKNFIRENSANIKSRNPKIKNMTNLMNIQLLIYNARFFILCQYIKLKQ